MFTVEILNSTDSAESTKYKFFDDDTEVTVTFDFTEMQNNPKSLNFEIDFFTVKRSKKITNFQLKKKVKRTAKWLIYYAIEYIKTENLKKESENV